jgi:hypothetical protein
MSQKLTPKQTPLTAQELVEAGWVARVRRAILDNGNAIRTGKGNTIQGQTINQPDNWCDILLPNGGFQLASSADCALVVDMLEGKTPIPEPVRLPETT